MWTRNRYNPETLQMEEVKLTGREIFQLVGLRVAFVVAIVKPTTTVMASLIAMTTTTITTTRRI